MTKKYVGNGNYVLEYLNLFIKDDNTQEELVWDMAPHMVEMSLFESIDSSTMTGYVAIIDTFNANELLPLYGNERIELSFYTAGSEQNPITYIGYVYKTSEKHRISEHSSGYKISFCSEAAIMSKRSFVHKSFTDTPSNIVKSIYNASMKNFSTKPIRIQSTKGVSTYLYGAVEPLEAIGVLSKYASGSDGSVGFMFYENNKEFVFESIESMYQRDVVASYTNQHGGVYNDVKQRAVEQFESYQDITIKEENSFMDRMIDGVHGSNFGHFDMKNKRFVNFQYSKKDNFEPTKSLGALPDKRYVENGNDVQTITYEKGAPTLFFDEIKGKMKRIESETFKADVSVFGDSVLKVGDSIRLTVPNLNVDQENLKTMFDGKVLIGSIRHTLTIGHYAQVLGVRKDSYEEIT